MELRQWPASRTETPVRLQLKEDVANAYKTFFNANLLL